MVWYISTQYPASLAQSLRVRKPHAVSRALHRSRGPSYFMLHSDFVAGQGIINSSDFYASWDYQLKIA